MKLESGQYYKCRNGEIIGPMIEHRDGYDNEYYYEVGGWYYESDGSFSTSQEGLHPKDIIELVTLRSET